MTDRTPHGTLGGYSNWGCRCGLCRTANADYQAALRRRYSESADVPHGTVNAYTNYGCRCEACRTAKAESAAAYKARKVGGAR